MKRHNSLGFALTEMLVLLGLLGVVALAGGRLFESLIRLNRASAEAANAAASFDSMTQSLRRDAWSATELSITHSAARLRSGPTTVNWMIADAVICRDDGYTTRRWPITVGASLSIDGPALVLRLADTNGGSEIRFVSHVKLLAGSVQ